MELLDTLVTGVRSACASFSDARRGDVRHSMADIGMSAFSLFFMQSESFLAHQRSLEEGRATSNCRTLFGMAAVPTDNHIRAMLDPVHPAHLQPVFDQVLDELRQRGGLAPFQRLGARVLVALDGTEYFCSQKIGCPGCLTRHRATSSDRWQRVSSATASRARLRRWRSRPQPAWSARFTRRRVRPSACCWAAPSPSIMRRSASLTVLLSDGTGSPTARCRCAMLLP